MKAMELVSVIKMQKAISNNLASRAYSNSANNILAHVFENIDPKAHHFLEKREGTKTLVILITSDRGLCGGLNMRVIKKALEETQNLKEFSFITIGKSGRDFLKTYGYKIIAEFTKISDRHESYKIKSIIKIAATDFLNRLYDKVVVCYPHFYSTLSQVPTVLELLPFSEPEDLKVSGEKITFEPGKGEVLDDLIPRILEIKMWQVILESIASEHSARMVAMKNANENADDLISDLTLNLNQTRQAGITRELAEISASKMTLEGTNE